MILDRIKDLHHSILKTRTSCPCHNLVYLIQQNNRVLNLRTINTVPDLAWVRTDVCPSVSFDNCSIVLASERDSSIGAIEALSDGFDD